MISAKLEKAREKFRSKPQMLQFLAKEYAKQFLPFADPKEFYAKWKEKKGVASANDFSDEDLDDYINQFEASIDWNTP